jgi:hypothetical protein
MLHSHRSPISAKDVKSSENYNLRFETRDGYLYARLTSESMTLELAKRDIQEIADKCRESGAQCVIIERDCPDTLSNAMSYLAISELCQLAEPGFRMGIVDMEEANRSHLKFGLRSLERDDIEVQIFENVDEAEAWLSNKAGSQY